MKRGSVKFLGVAVLLLVSAGGDAVVYMSSGGEWPDTWPEELEPLREQASTVYVHHGTQETVYEIPFKDREDFERAWPRLLAVKSPGGPLILEDYPSDYAASSMGPGVRLLCPHTGTLVSTDAAGNKIELTWPPKEVVINGAPPEYVRQKGDAWVPAEPGDRVIGSQHRARVDVMLVVDGEIVDLNRIKLPADTLVEDRRFAYEVVEAQ